MPELQTPPREHILRAGDGTPIFIADWPGNSAQEQCGGIVLMHGMGEHCGRYAHVARFFNECGWSVRAYDHRGHGRSGGTRGDAPDNDAIVRDAKIVIGDFAQGLSAPPLLLGHSMGGLFAAQFAIKAVVEATTPLRGLILSSPALAISMTGAQRVLFKTLKAIAPGLPISTGLHSRHLSHDPAMVAAYDNDPLVHAKISARFLNGMFEAIDFCHAHAAALTIPTLMVAAGDERVIDGSGSEKFFRRLAPGIGAMHVYPGFYHEIFNEIDANRVFDDVRAWLEVHSVAMTSWNRVRSTMVSPVGPE